MYETPRSVEGMWAEGGGAALSVEGGLSFALAGHVHGRAVVQVRREHYTPSPKPWPFPNVEP